jgi:hypothetical protein
MGLQLGDVAGEPVERYPLGDRLVLDQQALTVEPCQIAAIAVRVLLRGRFAPSNRDVVAAIEALAAISTSSSSVDCATAIQTRTAIRVRR